MANQENKEILQKSIKFVEYRCDNCNNLLFRGHLEPGTKIEVMCKKSLEKESQEDSKKPFVYRKCRQVKQIEA